MKNMCEHCYSLKKLEINNLQKEKTINVDRMFEGCYSLKKISFSKFNNNLLNIKKIFGNSNKIIKIYLNDQKLNVLCE